MTALIFGVLLFCLVFTALICQIVVKRVEKLENRAYQEAYDKNVTLDQLNLVDQSAQRGLLKVNLRIDTLSQDMRSSVGQVHYATQQNERRIKEAAVRFAQQDALDYQRGLKD
jgi:hypothetical protein